MLLDKSVTVTGFPEVHDTEDGGYAAIGELVLTTQDEYLIKLKVSIVGNGETKEQAINSYFLIAQQTVDKWDGKLEDFLQEDGKLLKGGYQLATMFNNWPYVAMMLFKKLHANAANNYSGYVDENEAIAQAPIEFSVGKADTVSEAKLPDANQDIEELIDKKQESQNSDLE